MLLQVRRTRCCLLASASQARVMRVQSSPSPAGRFYQAFYRWSRLHNISRKSRLAGVWSVSRLNSITESRKARPWCQSHIVSTSLPLSRSNRSQRLCCFSTSVTLKSQPGATPNPATDPPKSDTSQGLSTHMRHLMRRIPHPVVVITASAPYEADQSSLETTFRGMTVSSFNTVTLDPTPLVSFNVRTPSATHTALAASGIFLAHFLSSTAFGARIADVFAKGNHATGQAFKDLAIDGMGNLKIFTGPEIRGAPLLIGSGVLRALRCRVLPGKEIVVGDHVVLVAEVVGILETPSNKVGVNYGEEMGLIYVDRGYKRIGDPIAIDKDGPKDSSTRRGTRTEFPFHKTMGLNVRRGDELKPP